MTKKAQRTKLERAWDKVVCASPGAIYLSQVRSSRTTEQRRKDNRYYQLLNHWIKLKKENEAQNS